MQIAGSPNMYIDHRSAQAVCTLVYGLCSPFAFTVV